LFNQTTTVEGVFFVPGTNSLAFLGATAAEGKDVDSQALGSARTFYGDPANFQNVGGDPYRTATGTHSVGGKYEYQMWVYDIGDFAQILSGSLSPEDLKPQNDFRFDFGVDSGEAGRARNVGGVTMHWSTNRLYAIERLTNGPHLVHVYDFSD